jgi:hypothetical protein
MLKYPFTIRDANNEHYLNQFVKVTGIFRDCSKDSGLGNDVLILEAFGSTLVQSAWTDETGYYITYRLHPLYSKLDALKVAAAKAESKFLAMFPGKQFKRQVEDLNDPNTRITLLVECGSYSIGD